MSNLCTLLFGGDHTEAAQVGTIVHDRSIIITDLQITTATGCAGEEIVLPRFSCLLFILLDVVPFDGYVFVPIRACVFVEKSWDRKNDKSMVFTVFI